MTSNAFTLEESPDGIYKLRFDLPGEKVNMLAVKTLEELEGIIDQLSKNTQVKTLIILSGKKDSFVAGADIKEFGPAFENPELGRKIIETGQRVYSKLSKLPFPTVAAINGVCLGGGCELILSCTHRIAADHPKTIIGLPETSLGIIPGWGGTQRLPRLIGLKAGTDIVVAGKSVKAQKAFKMGLVDALAAPEILEEKAVEWALKGFPKKKRELALSDKLLQNNPLGRWFLFSQFKKGILDKTKGFYPAPLLALETIEKTYTLPLDQGLRIEADAFIQNAQTNVGVAKNLIGLFFGQEMLKKKGGFLEELPKGKEIKSSAVIGAGTMGGGISWLFSNSSIPVRMKDIQWDAIAHGTKAAWEVYYKFTRDRRLTPSESTNRFHEISWTLDYSGFGKKDFILESAVENLDLKKKIYAEIEGNTPKDAIIATNTSSLKVSDLGANLARPENFIGMHFFNPATRMPLVEIVPGPKTSPETLATTLDLARKLGKIPLVVGDCNGFLVNRIFMMAANEAFYFLQEGVSISDLDKAMLDFGMPMGSCQLADEVGLDVTYKVDKVFEAAYGERMKVPELLQKIYDAKLLGKKSGKGFYIHDGKKMTINPEAEKIVKSFNGKKTFCKEEIVERTLLAMINEASKCLEENIVRKAEEVDLAMVLGTGFPPFRGGPMAYADSLGIHRVLEGLKRLEASTSSARFKPSALIESMAKNNQKFIGK